MHRPTLALLLGAVLLAGCGDKQPGPPGRLDVAQVTASADRVAAVCAPDTDPGAMVDEPAITRDVEKIIAVYRRTDPDARFQLDGGGEPTTMRTILRTLEVAFQQGPCSAANADRIQHALDG